MTQNYSKSLVTTYLPMRRSFHFWDPWGRRTCQGLGPLPLILICFPANSYTSFLATFSSFNAAVTTPLVFDNALLNPGGHYNSGSGIYTVPLNGDYEFTIHLWSSNQYSIHPYLVVNGNRVHFVL